MFVKIRKFLNEFLLVDLIFWILNIFIYIDFKCDNLEIIIIVKWLLGFLTLYYLLFKFSKIIIFEKNEDQKLNLLKFSLIFSLFFISLVALLILLNLSKLPLIQNNYFRFWLILINIFSLILLYFYFSNHKMINWIFYPIRKKSKYYWNAIFICISLNLFISLFLSYCNTEQLTYSNENKLIWLKIFLLSFINCLCSMLKEFNVVTMLIITIMTIINLSLFFITALIFTDSLKTLFKEQKGIIFIPTIKSKKYQTIKINKLFLNCPLNIHQFKKKFWDKFSNYKNQIKEELVKDQYIFVNSNEKMNDILQNINKLLNNKLYEKYIDKINKNIIRIKDVNFITWFNANVKLINFNFSYYFQPLYKITIPNHKNIYKCIEDFSKKYSINFHILNYEKFNKNEKMILFFSLKKHSISLLQDFDNTRLKRIYYIRLKINSSKKFDLNTVKTEINEWFWSELELTLLKHFYYYNKCKKTLTLKFYDQFYAGEDKTKKILDLIEIKNSSELKNYKFKDLLETIKKIKCETFFEYKTESQEEREQILIKTLDSNYLVNKFYDSFWVNKLDKKQNKLDKKKEKNKKNNEQDTNNNLIMMDTPLHKVIVVTNNLDRLEQDFKEKIFNFIGFNNILNFNEKIYLSKSSFWDFPKEKHSFQFIVRNNFLSDAENLKRFKDLLNEYQYSYDRYNFNFNDQKDNKLNYQIIPITPLEDWDRYNKVSNNCEEIKIKIPKKFLHTHCCSKCIRKMKNK